jgi:tRNA-specific 2-thiouridylase
MNELLHKQVKGKKVFVGLSGGVDSAVTAALLQEAGADVIGVFIKGWYPEGMPCTWAADRRDAMRVAAHLGIPFHTLDASEEYKKGVIDYLLTEYGAGRTPNPDVMCNKEVKFGAFYRFAKDHSADFIATGHYAQIDPITSKLLRGVDEAKDQSYFLWAIPKETLEFALFPLGSMEKSETRILAKKFNLPVAEKKDSQGICFLGSISVEDFLRHELGSTNGVAVDSKGKRVGVHNGALLHTIGERVALEGAPSGPWYVMGKDIQKNELIVSNQKVNTTASSVPLGIRFTNSNWFTNLQHTAITAQFRYHGKKIEGTLSVDASVFTPHEALEETPAAGQSLVFYVGDQCIGGGIIAE